MEGGLVFLKSCVCAKDLCKKNFRDSVLDWFIIFCLQISINANMVSITEAKPYFVGQWVSEDKFDCNYEIEYFPV